MVFHSEVTSLVDEGRRVMDVAYVDFSEAFDKGQVSYNILIHELSKYSLDMWTVRWIENWLNNWLQRA